MMRLGLSGPAQLGYGDGDEATLINGLQEPGSSRPISATALRWPMPASLRNLPGQAHPRRRGGGLFR